MSPAVAAIRPPDLSARPHDLGVAHDFAASPTRIFEAFTRHLGQCLERSP